jgi:mono/diheme cytochrome c family protein
MTGRRTAAITTLVATIGLALIQPAMADDALRVEAGRHALDTRCSRCHAIGPDGQSPHAQAPPFRELMKRYPPESLAEALAEGIVSGHPDMPEYVLSPEEIEAVMAYLHTL